MISFHVICLLSAGEDITLDLVLQDLELQDQAWASLRSTLLHAHQNHGHPHPAAAGVELASSTVSNATAGGATSVLSGVTGELGTSSTAGAANGDNATASFSVDGTTESVTLAPAATVASGGLVAERVRRACVGPRHLDKALAHVKKRTATEIGAPQVGFVWCPSPILHSILHC
jgi:hypothetical protein